MIKRFAWSYSAYSDFKCPLRYKLKRIDKILEPPRPASDRGILIHKKAEHFIKGDITGMPKELKCFAPELKELRRNKAATEVDLAFTREWEPSKGDDWNNVWCRVYADVVATGYEAVKVVDHKTGKIYEDDIVDQAEINALGVWCHYDNVKEVNVEFLYYDLDDRRDFTFTSFKKLQTKWGKIAKAMEDEKEFKACPSHKCNWCSYSKYKGGSCNEG